MSDIDVTFSEKKVQKTLTTTGAVSNASDFLAKHTGLPKGRIKLAMGCGAVQLRKPRSKWQRLRRATASLPAGSILKINYDPALLAVKPPEPLLVADCKRYSVWFKPPQVLSQGNEWGDHCSLLRLVELHFSNKRQVFLVHRLDRDACGLMVVAHDKKAAALMSDLFSGRSIQKQYRVRVEGVLEEDTLRIDAPLDRKSAVTVCRCLERDEISTLLDVNIETGRKHQIRRHLSEMGHPVRGDALYGVRHSHGLHLAATKLELQCPVQGRAVCFEADADRIAFYWQ